MISMRVITILAIAFTFGNLTVSGPPEFPYSDSNACGERSHIEVDG